MISSPKPLAKNLTIGSWPWFLLPLLGQILSPFYPTYYLNLHASTGSWHMNPLTIRVWINIIKQLVFNDQYDQVIGSLNTMLVMLFWCYHLFNSNLAPNMTIPHSKSTQAQGPRHSIVLGDSTKQEALNETKHYIGGVSFLAAYPLNNP